VKIQENLLRKEPRLEPRQRRWNWKRSRLGNILLSREVCLNVPVNWGLNPTPRTILLLPEAKFSVLEIESSSFCLE